MPRTPKVSKSKSGFALVIALSLMAFMFMLALAIATMARIELTTTTLDNAQTEARANARLALQVAIGELQKAAGPDQRITATADIFSDQATGIQSPYWLGVWDSDIEDWETLDADQRLAQATWLVSGQNNPRVNNQLDPKFNLDAVPAKEKVTLVHHSGSPTPDEVVVLKDEIDGGAGRYGYWVADESQKARVDMVDEYHDASDHFEKTMSSQGVNRSGIEYLEFLENYPANQERAKNFADLSLAVVTSQSDEQQMSQRLIDEHFHALTPWSTGLLVDVKHGGLKRDLTQAFEYRHIFDEHFVPFDETDTRNEDADGEPVSPVEYVENLYFIEDSALTANGLNNPSITTSGPNWSILRSYYRQYIPGSRSPKFHYNKEERTGIESNLLYSMDIAEYNELQADVPPYLQGLFDLENSNSNTNTTNYRKYTGWYHYHPDYSSRPGPAGKPYQTVPSDLGTEGNGATKLISPVSDNYQLQSWLGPIISRLQLSFGLQEGKYGLELVVKPVMALYNPYNTDITIEGNLSAIGWNLNPIITIDVDGRELTEPVSFGLREVMPTNNQGRLSYRIYSEDDAEGKYVTIKAGETRYFGPNVMHPDYDDRRSGAGPDSGVYLMWADLDADGNIVVDQNGQVDVSQNQDQVRMTNYEPGGGGFIAPLELSYYRNQNKSASHRPRINGVTQLERYFDGNYGVKPTQKRDWNFTPEEWNDLKKLTESVTETDAEGNVTTTPRGFNFEIALETDFGSGYSLSYAGSVDLMAINKMFADVDSAQTLVGVNRYFSSLADATNQDQILSVGFWLKTTTENKEPWRNLIDSNIRAIAANSEWDGFDLDNGYKILSTYATEDAQGGHGVLSNSAAEIQLNDLDRADGFWGNSIGAQGQTRVILFDRPRTPLLSLGNLQHANLGRYNFDPTYMAGNSYANVRIPLDQTSTEEHQAWVYYNDENQLKDYESFKIFDTSYLINEKLWDRYFFSGLTADVDEDDLEAFKRGQPMAANQRYRYIESNRELTAAVMDERATDDTLFQSLAANLEVIGAFNVNSTSVKAWKAVLAGMSQSELPYFDGDLGNLGEAISISRFTWPYRGYVNLADGSGAENFWNGVREIDEVELDNLAQAIVNQVKLRGPFLSLSDFVNRSLANDETGKSGPLQAALDDAILGLNTQAKLNPFSDEAADSISGDGFYDVFPETNMQAAGFPGYVLQGDLLQRLGPTITVRGDTFLVRTYGECVDPITGETQAEAWCEAVVQRTVTPVDPDPNNVESETIYPSSPFGRQFELVSFRWLKENEI
ncbi:hypothetical protein [Cerasicoccus fimbriatus]|uniref:hypothetical protein n=1 Tax=Cerasicoccus fimbriatus TaxID=3014554 RepID=UPI0022B59C95|nr:hypothetical protein [Cerasicoccus sp. TK19100]